MAPRIPSIASKHPAVLGLSLMGLGAGIAQPDGEAGTRDEPTASSAEALDPSQGMPPTTFRFTLSEVRTRTATEPPPSMTNDTGYVDWAALSLQNGPREPDVTSCSL